MELPCCRPLEHQEELTALRQVGLTAREKEMVFITDEPKLPAFLCFPATVTRYRTHHVIGQGIHHSAELARTKAVAECIERLCLDNPPSSRLVTSRYGNANMYDPAQFRSCSSEHVSVPQFEFESRNSPFACTPATDLLNHNTLLLPAQLIWLSDDFLGEFRLRGESISTGAAVGFSFESTVQTGLFEAIERDACMHAYLKRRQLRRIVDLPDAPTALIEYLRRYCLEISIYDITTDLCVPTVLAVALDHTGIGCAVNTGSCTSSDFLSAIQGAMLESVQCRRSGRVMKEFDVPTEYPSADEIHSMESRFYYWYNPERLKDIHPWLEDAVTISFSEIEARRATLETALAALQQRRFDVFAVDIALNEMKAAGIWATKVVVPQLHPLYLDERAKALFSFHYGSLPNDASLPPHPFT